MDTKKIITDLESDDKQNKDFNYRRSRKHC